MTHPAPLTRPHFFGVLGALTLLISCSQHPAPAASSALNAQAGTTVSGAVYTSTNPADGSDTCKNGRDVGSGVVNCNIYTDKNHVWLSGGPTPSAALGLEDGTYFFAILVPGQQKGPLDGVPPTTDKNLSDDFDTYQNRTFTFIGGKITSYIGTHDFDSALGRIRAMPYTDTSNNGGEYILAVCSLANGYAAVTPSKCKYDAFKVREQDPPTPSQVTAVLSGNKYRDDNLNGRRNISSEPGLPNWTITLDCGADGSFTAVTDQDGAWSQTLSFPSSETATTTCTVTETQVVGWQQTGNTQNEATSSDDTVASVDLTAKTYTVTIKHSDDSTVQELNFGNVPLSQISGQKLYGTTGTTPIPFWQVKLSGTTAAGAAVTSTTTTDATGRYTFGSLLPGSYTVTESRPSTNPANTKWAPLSATFYTVTVSASGVTTTTPVPLQVPVAAFRNVCQVNPGGKTIGFWSNKNGAAAFATIPGGLGTLVALNLRDAKGANFDPTTYAKYQSWLLSATASNMAYMLSAQMSATKLNTLKGFTAADVTVSSPAVGTLTVAELVQKANDSLKAPAGTLGTGSDIVNTTASGPTRISQDGLQKLLNVINNTGEASPMYFDQPGSGRCTSVTDTTVWTTWP